MSRMTIRKKILLGFIIGAVLPIFLLEVLELRNARRELEMQQMQALDAIADLKKQRIESFFQEIAEDAAFMSHLEIITEPLPAVSEHFEERDTPAYQEARMRLDRHLIPTRQQKHFLEIILADTEGRMVYNTGAVHNDSELGMSVEALVSKNQFDTAHAHDHSVEEVYVSDVFASPFAPSGFELVSAAPVFQEDGMHSGMVILAIDMGPVFDLILDTTGLGETGETLIGRNEGDHALFINPLRHDPDAALSRKAPYASNDALPIREATQGIKGSGVTTDYRAESIIASWRPLELPNKDLSWGLVAKIDTSEAFAGSQRLLVQALSIGVGAILLLIIANIYLGRSIVRPLQEVRKAASLVAGGSLDTRVLYKGKDEIGDLGKSFNHMTDELARTRVRLADQNKELEENVTELERSKKATLNVLEDVEEEKERIKTILNSIGDGVFVVGTDQVIQAINPIAADLSGWDAQEALGKPYKKVLRFVDEKTQRVNDRFIVDAIRTGEIQEMSNHTMLVKSDGTKIPVADSAAPLKDAQGQVRGCVVVFRDISKEYAVDKAKSEFVSLASHQLRTPLAAINWNLEMLLEDSQKAFSAEQKQSFQDLYSSSKRMSELVTALLNVSRIELGTFVVEPEQTDIIALTKEVVKDLEPKIKEKKLKLKEQYDSKSLRMNVDPKLMRMVIENIVSNAVKYTPEKKNIEVTIAKKDPELVIEVRDEGYGIPRKQQSKIFTRLFRADNVRAKDVEGTGLGLYIVKSIVERSEGTIRFESKENQGTTFYITLPLAGMKKKAGLKNLSDS